MGTLMVLSPNLFSLSKFSRTVDHDSLFSISRLRVWRPSIFVWPPPSCLPHATRQFEKRWSVAACPASAGAAPLRLEMHGVKHMGRV